MRIPFLDKLRNRNARRDQVRRFDGSTGGRRAGGMGVMGPINPEVGAAAATLRSRARYMASNNPHMALAVANWVGALIGSGITATSTNAEASAHFNTWASSADYDQRTDWTGLQADIARSMVVDGEAFVQIVMADDGIRLRLIPPELVDESRTMELPNGGYVVRGIEFDATGRRVGYWIFPSRPTDQFPNYAPAVRFDAADILHIMKPLAAGQVRGVSWLAPVILAANEFDQTLDALIVGVKVAAMHAGFLIDQNGTGEPYDGTGTGGILESGLEPGTLKRLPSGMDVKFSTPQQAQQATEFLKLQLRQLAAGLGLPDHLLSGDLSGANYSSLRAGLLPFRQRVEAIQYHTFVPQLLGPVWQRVITYGVMSGEIDAPDFESNPRAFAATWLPPKPLQVDPLKDVEADVAEIAAGLTSRRKAVAERGWDVVELDTEIAADRNREKALGLTFTDLPANQPSEPQNG